MKIKKILPLAILVFVCTFISGCTEKKATSTEYALNTVITITAYGDKADYAIDSAFDEVKRIENLLSCHIDTSEISFLNKNAHLAPVEVSNETLIVIKKAMEMSKKTNGAFDITVKPLVDLWNITGENAQVPSDESINKTLDCVGFENVKIEKNKVSFLNKDTKIDLGGAAKGYCADKVVEVLKNHGIKNAIIDLGGNIYALGKNERGDSWRVGLQDPAGQRGNYFSVENLSDMTAVTSGSYERYFEKDGRIYHHILNPHTGHPADSSLVSVTVIGTNSFESDMLSTAIFVMGAEEFSKISHLFDYEKYITVDKYNNARTYEK